MSITSSNGNFSVLQLLNEGSAPKVDISLSNGVNIYSINTTVTAGATAAPLPNHSLFIDSTGAFGMIEDGVFKLFLTE